MLIFLIIDRLPAYIRHASALQLDYEDKEKSKNIKMKEKIGSTLRFKNTGDYVSGINCKPGFVLAEVLLSSWR